MRIGAKTRCTPKLHKQARIKYREEHEKHRKHLKVNNSHLKTAQLRNRAMPAHYPHTMPTIDLKISKIDVYNSSADDIMTIAQSNTMGKENLWNNLNSFYWFIFCLQWRLSMRCFDKRGRWQTEPKLKMWMRFWCWIRAILYVCVCACVRGALATIITM